MARAQVKMFETLAVLVVFFFFLIFGASFYFKLQENALHRELERNTQLQAIQVAQKVSSLPELDCSFAGVTRDNCMDTQKIKALTTLTARPDAITAYFEIFSYSTITTHIVYPFEQVWVIYDKPRGDQATVIQVPLLFYEPMSAAYHFGYLEVKVYA